MGLGWLCHILPTQYYWLEHAKIGLQRLEYAYICLTTFWPCPKVWCFSSYIRLPLPLARSLWVISNGNLLMTKRKHVKRCWLNIWELMFHLFFNLSFCSQKIQELSISKYNLWFVLINLLSRVFATTRQVLKISINLDYLILRC